MLCMCCVCSAMGAGCLPDGNCSIDVRDCCSGKFHQSVKCGSPVGNRCGCVPTGSCAIKQEDCCGGAFHSTLKCGAGLVGGRCDDASSPASAPAPAPAPEPTLAPGLRQPKPEIGCLDDGVCALDTRDCCSGKFHETIKCGGAVLSKRCGCVQEGDCALKEEDCCSSSWHTTLKCGAGLAGGRCDGSGIHNQTLVSV